LRRWGRRREENKGLIRVLRVCESKVVNWYVSGGWPYKVEKN